MNLLLDTHAFIWWDSQDPALGAAARAAIQSQANKIFVSAATVWEIAIKRRLGKLAFSGSAAAAISANGFFAEPVQPIDAENAGDLRWPHADPFDRLLVVQAMRLGCVMVTADQTVRTFDQVPFLSAR